MGKQELGKFGNKFLVIGIVLAMIFSTTAVMSGNASAGTDAGNEFSFPETPPIPPFTIYGMIYAESGNPTGDASVTITNLRTGDSLKADVYENGAYEAILEDLSSGYEVGDEIEITVTANSQTIIKHIEVKQIGFGERVDIRFGDSKKDAESRTSSTATTTSSNEMENTLMPDESKPLNSEPVEPTENSEPIIIDPMITSSENEPIAKITLTDMRAPPYFRLAFTEKENDLRFSLLNEDEERFIVSVDLYHVEPDGITEAFLKTVHFGTLLPGREKFRNVFGDEEGWIPTEKGRNWIRGEIYVKGHGHESIFVNEFRESFNVVPGWRPVLELGTTVITEPTVWENLTVVINGDLTVNAPLDIVSTDVIGDDLTVTDIYSINPGSAHDMAASSDGQYRVEVKPAGTFEIFGKLWNNPDNAHYWFYMNGTLNVDAGGFEGYGIVENTYGDPDISKPGGIICTTDNVLIENGATVRNGKTHGIWLDNSDAVIRDSFIKDNGGDGIAATDFSNATIDDNSITGNGRNGIACIENSDSMISNNSIKYNSVGIKIIDSSPVVINNENISLNMNVGMWLNNNSGTIVNNTISSNGMEVLYFDDMENGVGNWTYDGFWHRVNNESGTAPPWNLSYSGNYSWWYGQDSTGDYNDTLRNYGNLTSPVISIPQTASTILTFRSWYETDTSSINTDQRWVKIYDSTNYNKTFQLYEDGMSRWTKQYIDISDFKGRDVQIDFYFDTIDDQDNGFQGWYIDDLQIVKSYPNVLGYGIYCENNATTMLENNLIEMSWYGIYSDNSSLNLTEDNYITMNEYGIYLYQSSPYIGYYDPTTGSKVDISPTAAPGPLVTSGNTITGNYYGIYVNQSTPFIYDNTISAHNRQGHVGDGWGIYVIDSNSTGIYANYFSGNMVSIYTSNSSAEIGWNAWWGEGIVPEASELPYGGVEGVNSSLHIFENTVDGLGFGSTFIKLQGCDSTTKIENNTISPNTGQDGWGVSIAIELTNASPVVQNNTIDGKANNPKTGDYGIRCFEVSNPKIANNMIFDLDYFGVYVDNSSPIINNNEIYNNLQYGIYLANYSNSDVINCTISNSGSYDFYLSTDSHATALNTDFNKSKVYFNDALSTLTVQWFMDVRVVDENYAPVPPGANVWVNDTFGSNVVTSTTPADGWIRWIHATEYVQNKTTTTYHTAHNITASNTTLTGWAMPEPFMDKNREVYVLLGTGNGYNIFLHEGWNFISVPFMPFNMSSKNILSVLTTIDGKYDIVHWYDSQDSLNLWKSYNANFPGTQSLTHLNHTMGFWINILEDCTLFSVGEIVSSEDIPLYEGWNMVGYPSATPRQAQNTLPGWGTTVTKIAYYNASAPDDITETTDGTYVMSMGNAYWVYATAATTWTVSW